MSLREYILIKEHEDNEKIKQQNELEKKFKNTIIDLDKKIEKYKLALSSFQTSYKNISEIDVDGLPINKIEYEFLNLDKTNKYHEIIKTNTDIDLDGEPI